MADIPSTQWTLISMAKSPDRHVAETALNQLCNLYWFPVYAFIRSSDRTAHDAQDLTQAFFEKKVISGELFQKADKTKGRLRTLVLTAVKNLIHSEWQRGQAVKRGAGALHFSIDEAAAEGWYGAEPVDTMTADRLFQRRWAVAVLEAAMKELREKYAARGRAETFDVLRGFLGVLSPDAKQASIEQAAATLGMNEGTLRTAISRLRKQFQEILRHQVAMTLDEPTEDDIRDELTELNDFL